jgi:hypothetical protein
MHSGKAWIGVGSGKARERRHCWSWRLCWRAMHLATPNALLIGLNGGEDTGAE